MGEGGGPGGQFLETDGVPDVDDAPRGHNRLPPRQDGTDPDTPGVGSAPVWGGSGRRGPVSVLSRRRRPVGRSGRVPGPTDWHIAVWSLWSSRTYRGIPVSTLKISETLVFVKGPRECPPFLNRHPVFTRVYDSPQDPLVLGGVSGGRKYHRSRNPFFRRRFRDGPE